MTRTRWTTGAMPAAMTAAMKTRMSTCRTAHSNAVPATKARTMAVLRANTPSSPRPGNVSRETKGMIDSPSAEVLADGRLELRPRHRADDPSPLHSIAEEDDGRNALHAECAHRLLVLIDIELAEADVTALRGQLFDEWSDHAARAAPRCPEIDDHRPACNGVAERGIGDRHRMTLAIPRGRSRGAIGRGQLRLALSADDGLSRRIVRQPVLRAALGARYDHDGCLLRKS